MIDWTQATDVELAVLWCALHYDDGLFYEDGSDSNEGDVQRAVDSEVERRGLGKGHLTGLAWR